MDFVSIDELGHIFVWKYENSFLRPSNGRFRPWKKYRIPLDCRNLKKLGSKELKLNNNKIYLKTLESQALDIR